MDRFNELKTWQILYLGNARPKRFLLVNILYRYIGHNGGEKYFGSKDIKNLFFVNTALFLVGCSSLKLYKKDHSEVIGIASDYLMKSN